MATNFDHRSVDYAERVDETEADLRFHSPVSWSEQHGGFWAVSTHDGVTGVLRDRELASSEKVFDENGNVIGGLIIPGTNAFRLVPDEVDPPAWDGYRKLLNPVFSPPAVRAMRPRMEQFTTEVINDCIESGRADLIEDIAQPATALITMDIMGLPLLDWEFYAEPIHLFSHSNTHPDIPALLQGVFTRLEASIAERRVNPDGGLVSRLIATPVNGNSLTNRELLDISYQLLVGGFDTTAALLGNAFWHLDEHRNEHQRLIEDDHFLTTATEEFLRWSSPVMNMGRTARCPIDVEGQRIEAGDRMLIMYHSANRDPQYFENPDEVDLSRFPNRHLGFGSGIHRCLGSNLARAVFQVVLRHVLVRMPDFTIDRPNARRFAIRSTMNGFIDMPIFFTPGERIPSGLDIPGGIRAQGGQG